MEHEPFSKDLQEDLNVTSCYNEKIFALFYLIMKCNNQNRLPDELRMHPPSTGDIDFSLRYSTFEERIQVKSRDVNQNCWTISTVQDGIIQLILDFIGMRKRQNTGNIKYLLFLEGDIQRNVAETFSKQKGANIEKSILAIERIITSSKRLSPRNITLDNQREIAEEFLNHFRIIPRFDREFVTSYLHTIWPQQIFDEAFCLLHNKEVLNNKTIRYLVRNIGIEYRKNTIHLMQKKLKDYSRINRLISKNPDLIPVNYLARFEDKLAITFNLGVQHNLIPGIEFNLFYNEDHLIAKVRAENVTNKVTYAVISDKIWDKEIVSRWKKELEGSNRKLLKDNYFVEICKPPPIVNMNQCLDTMDDLIQNIKMEIF